MKKKVLHLLASNSYSGAENVVCTIIDNCSDKYEMYYCSPNGPIKDILDNRGINYIPLKRLSVLEVRKIVKEHNIDIIQAHDYKASFCATLLGFKGKIISYLHCDYNLLFCSFIVGRIYAIIQKRFDKIVVVSKEILDNAYFANKILDRVEVINNVVDKNLIIDKSMEFDSTYYDLIYLGRLTEIKKPEMVIEITRKLKERYPKIRTCIIGSGNLEERCNKLIKEYNLEDNIDMLGFLDNPFPYIKNSKIALLTSSYEGLPMSVIECMILGVPVLNSGVGGLASLFRKYPDFICDTVDDYVNAIDGILSGNKNLSKYCDKIIRDVVDIKQYIKKQENLYEEVLK